MLRIEHLLFSHPDAPAPLFQSLSGQIPAGTALVCGDESTGKSTLLRLLAGRLAPQGGRLSWQDAPLRSADVAWFDPLEPSRNEHTVQRVLAEVVTPAGQPALPELLDGLSLEPHLHKPLYQLSTGSRRKVFIAAALAAQAPVTLLDQPFMALDQPSIAFICSRLAHAAQARDRLVLLADYAAPEGLALSATLDLDAGH